MGPAVLAPVRTVVRAVPRAAPGVPPRGLVEQWGHVGMNAEPAGSPCDRWAALAGEEDDGIGEYDANPVHNFGGTVHACAPIARSPVVHAPDEKSTGVSCSGGL
eukprot:3386196-Pyramimonas_sp.AAC.1